MLAEIAAADGIAVVHPNWWGQPPAILNCRADGVLRPGVTYTFASTPEQRTALLKEAGETTARCFPPA
jgi:putative NADPH-quinone reductase